MAITSSVVNSSARVGWIPTVSSKSCFVAPQLIFCNQQQQTINMLNTHYGQRKRASSLHIPKCSSIALRHLAGIRPDYMEPDHAHVLGLVAHELCEAVLNEILMPQDRHYSNKHM